MPETTLDISDLTITSGGRTLVDRLSLRVEPGEVVALVGESGSGKSLTGRAILGLLPGGVAATGSVILAGDEVVGRSEHDLRPMRGTHASMIFQEPQTALNPSQKIGTQIFEVLRAHRRVDKKAARVTAIELLTSVGIPEPATRVDWYPHQLSGGQKQRVVIALALAGEAKLIIADEPTTALDVTVQASILELFRTLRAERGVSILLVTHNLGVVANIADRVVVLRAGEFIEEAPVATLFAEPSHEYTRRLLAAVPSLSTEASPNVDLPAPILTVTDLTVRYPGGRGRAEFAALDGVSLTIGRGEVLGVVGESGSGKTTLGRAILGLTPVTSGTIDRQASRLALIHQDPFASLDPRWSVARSVTEPLRVKGTTSKAELKKRAAELLDAVQLPAHLADRKPTDLSGGQRQRVAFARALASDPELIIADEPTSALDVSVQAAVLELFGELQSELGFAALFITHDLAVVSDVADVVAVLRGGRLVEIGRPGPLFAAPGDEYTRALVAAVPVPDPAVQRARREEANR